MPDVLIHSMELPKKDELLSINIWPNGNVTIAMDLECKPVARAVELPPHGDLISLEDALIDADERAYDFWTSDDEANGTKQFLMAQPVVVPAERRDYP